MRTSWFSWYVHTANGPSPTEITVPARLIWKVYHPGPTILPLVGSLVTFIRFFNVSSFVQCLDYGWLHTKKRVSVRQGRFTQNRNVVESFKQQQKKSYPDRRVFSGYSLYFTVYGYSAMREWRIRTRTYVIKCRPLAVGPWTTHLDQTRVSLFFISMRAFNTIQYKDALQIITESSIWILSVSACVTVNINLQLCLCEKH